MNDYKVRIRNFLTNYLGVYIFRYIIIKIFAYFYYNLPKNQPLINFQSLEFEKV